MNFDSVENLLKYADNTICQVKHKSTDKWSIGYISSRGDPHQHQGKQGIPRGLGVPEAAQPEFDAERRIVWRIPNGDLAEAPQPVPEREYNHIYLGDNINKPVGIKRAKDWDIKSPINGYIQAGDIATYLAREPKRMWKVGFCKTNTHSHVWDVHPALNITEMIYQLHEKQSFARDIDNALMSKCKSRVLSTRYAVSKDYLYYRGEPVADVSLKNSTIMFPNRRHAEFHRTNLASKVGSFEFTYEPEKKALRMKDYNYDYDV